MKSKGIKKTVSAFAIALVLALTSVVAVSAQQGTQEQGGQGRNGWHGERGKGRRGMKRGFGSHFGNLNLTDAQKEQMKQIATRFHESFKAMRQQGRGERRGGGFGAFNGGTFNEAEVRAAAQARANARVEMEVARARMMFEMYNVLTAEQKAQLAAQRQQWEQKRQERRARRQANPATTNQ